MKKITLGIIAHVDSGKTTLSEALLFKSGTLRSFGRVDKGESFLDGNLFERKRGITIYSKPAEFSTGSTEFTLLDTPGHSDFSAEMERTLQVLDYAILLISGTDGIKGQTETLWKLLKEYRVPTFVFFNKMDQPGANREFLLREVGARLSDSIVDFSCINFGKMRGNPLLANSNEVNKKNNNNSKHGENSIEKLLNNCNETTILSQIQEDSIYEQFTSSVREKQNSNNNKIGTYSKDKDGIVNQVYQPELCDKCIIDELFDDGLASQEKFYDSIAMCDESAMEEYLETGAVSFEKIKRMILERKLFPCFFGSALKIDGIKELIHALDELTLEKEYPDTFGARVFKILRDENGKRLTMMKITGGVLKSKDLIEDGDEESKINQIRIYSGDKFRAVNEVSAGDICVVEGLKNSFAGQGFGTESEEILPLLSPVLSYRVLLPKDEDPIRCLPYFKTLEEESPELAIGWEEEKKEISVRVMGEVQLEILTSVMEERFGLKIAFDTGRIIYKETLASPVIGVGHFEPLRHYAEVHLFMEPLPEGSGLVFDTDVSTDSLAKNWQRLILTHLSEREHRGVLTGSPITDMKITVIGGRAHLKHTEGGDFRQATYRAVRQGLMMGVSRLLEPYYRFVLELPSENVGRAMTDLDKMKADFTAPDLKNNEAVITGRVPVAAFADYAKELSAYTKGQGRVMLVSDGYGPCHNPEEVIETRAYDPLSDLRNTPDSVFCGNGAGFVVPYDQVYDYMQVPFNSAYVHDAGLKADVDLINYNVKQRQTGIDDIHLGTEEVDSIIAGISRCNKTNKNAEPGWRKHYAKMAELRDKGTEKAKDATVNIKVFDPESSDYLLVDGYNVIFAWEELSDLVKDNIDGARTYLLDVLCNYQALVGCEIIVVFDAYRVAGHKTEYMDYNNIHVVYTAEAETADKYIERFAHEKGKKYKVAVVTSDGLEQIIIRGQGCALVSSREFKVKVDKIQEKYRDSGAWK